MKKAIIFIMCVILLITLTQSAFAGGNDSTAENPLVFIKGDDQAYIDDIYSAGVYIKNIKDIEYAEIIVHYNPEVLEHIYYPRIVQPIGRAHSGGVLEDKPGELRVIIKKYYDVGYHSENDVYRYLDFDVIGAGSTDFSVEVKEAICSNGMTVDLDVSDFVKKTQINKYGEPYIGLNFNMDAQTNYEGIGKNSIYNEIYEMEINTKNACLFEDVSILIQYDPKVIKFSKKVELKPGYSINFMDEGKLTINYKASENTAFIFNHEEQKLQYIMLGGNTEIYFTMVKNVTSNGKKIRADLNPVQITLEPIEIVSEVSDTVLTISGTSPLIGELDDYFETRRSHFCENPENIEKVTIEEGITGIGTDVFAEYVNLKNISIPHSVRFIEKGAIPENTVIHADSMSPAERYATVYGNPFVLPEGTLIGDTDKDGVLTADDALDVLFMAAQIDDLYKYTADYNGDGIVDAVDALEILKTAAKLNEEPNV